MNASIPAAQVPEIPVKEGRLGIAWATGAVPQAIAFNAFSLLYFRYLTDTVGIEAALVGTIIALSKIYDAIIAPFIGWITDTVETRMGRRRPWMLAGGLTMAVSMVICFTVPLTAAYELKLAWASVGVFLFSTGYMLFAIPWLAMPPEIVSNMHARTKMMAWRVGFSSLGQGLATAAGPMLLAALGASYLGYSALGWMVGIVCGLGTLVTVFATRSSTSMPVRDSGGISFFQQWKTAVKSRPFVVLLILKGTLYSGLAFSGAALALMTRWGMGLSDYWLGSYALASVATLLLFQPVWVRLAGKFGKHRALTFALIGFIIGHISLVFNPGSGPMLIGQALYLGCMGGGIYMLTQSFLPDVIEDDYIKSGTRRGGVYAGTVSFVEACAPALALLLMGFLLSAAGYVEGLGESASQPENARRAIMACGALVPAFFAGLCIFILPRFPLGRD